MNGSFSALFGNEAVRERLLKAIKNSTLPHAFLVTGKEGSGKKTLARELAMALNCENRDANIPCHSCKTCRRIKDGNYTDIYTLRREGTKATVGVEQVRTFKSSIMLSPVESQYKVYVIEDTERLTVQAQNALLTFLEEPPRNTYILLLALSADSILTTIKSRTQLIKMERFEPQELKKYVEALSEKARNLAKREPDSFEDVIMSSDGVIGEALRTIEEGGAGETKDNALLTQRLMECICQNQSYQELYSAMCTLPTDRKKFIIAIERVLLALRDVLLCKFDERCVPVFYSKRERALELSKKISSKKLTGVYGILTGAIEDAGGNVGISSIITSVATKIKLL